MLKYIIPILFITFNLFAQQKVVLISGASSGIGLATAKAFQEKGWKVWAGYRQNVPEELKQLPCIRLVSLDVTSDKSVTSAMETLLKEEGRLDALINNAGYGLIGAEECLTIKEAKKIFDVNFFGPLRLTQAALPTMRKQQSGHIICISSGVGVHPYPGLGLYSASKFALESLSESLAVTVSPWNIKVSLVEPGFVKNNWGTHCQVGSRECHEPFYQKLTKAMCDMLATPRGQSSQEIAELIVKIAETPEPNMRYQTNEGMRAYIAERLVDPTGNKERDNNLKFIKSLTK